MLKKITISNIALIEELTLELPAGFSCLTGETGAGKSIIIGALGFVLGERASHDIIRSGAQKARVEAVFTDCPSGMDTVLQDIGLEREDGMLTLSRELSVSGRNVCRVNGTMVTAADLKLVGDLLVDIHGQHEHQRLLRPENHCTFLDAFDAARIAPLAEQCRREARHAKALRRKLKEINQNSRERARLEDLYRYQLSELNAAALQGGEEETLLSRRQLQRNARKILDAIQSAENLLGGDDGSIDHTDGAWHAMDAVAGLSAEYRTASARLEEAYYNLVDIREQLAGLRESLAYEPEELEHTEERLALIGEMKRKYGPDIASILAYRDGIEKELSSLTGSSETTQELQEEYRLSCHAYRDAAMALHTARERAAGELGDRIQAQLRELGMGKAVFLVHMGELPIDGIPDNGIDQVEFLLGANAGEEAKPLARIASGGELSRVMLALKRILSETDDIMTMVFDEIDTGISGLIANAVADKMAEIASGKQVLCITHLPQIAASADAQFVVSKQERDGRTYTFVRRLTDVERPCEIARIMGASADDVSAVTHAEEMLAKHGHA